MENSSTFVVVLGLATTFIGLICIIFLTKIMSILCRFTGKKEMTKDEPKAGNVSVPSVRTEQIPNRGEFVAAISAAIAEDMGKDVSSIRILSIKKI